MNRFQGDAAALNSLLALAAAAPSDSPTGDGDVQGQRLLRLDFPQDDGPDALMLANGLDADEGLSRDFCYLVDVLSDDAAIALADVIGRMVTVSLLREDGSTRHFNGYVGAFALVKTDGGFAFYRMRLQPWLAWLHLRQDCRLFQHVTVTDLCEQLFATYLQRDYRTRIAGDLPLMTLAVQYNESDHNHLHRRLEDAGLYYWYEHRFDGHTLWIADDSTQAEPITGERDDMPWQRQAGAAEDDGIHRWSPQQRASAGAVSINSYDFKLARAGRADRSSLNRQGAVPPLEVYADTGAYGFKNDADGELLATQRMQARDAQGQDVDATGNDRTAQPGRSFFLSGQFDPGAGAQDYLIVAVHHRASNNYQDGRHAVSSYENRLTCLRKDIPWRPAPGFNSRAVTPPGVQTARVAGPAGEEIHTDEYGRVRLQFHWDRLGRADEASSPWVRVMTTWAGSGFGQISLPRIGQEVVVQFLDGNPDRPLVVGSVYNESHLPPWPLPAHKTQSGVLTRSSQGGTSTHANALRFEDLKGEEEVWLHAEKNQRIEVEHDEAHWVGNDRAKSVGCDETVNIGRDRKETVGRHESITVHGDRRERVDGDERIDIGANRDELVSGNESLRIRGNRTERVDLAKAETVRLAKALNVGGAYEIGVGGAMNTAVTGAQLAQIGGAKSTSVGRSYAIDAGEVFSIDVGAAHLRLSSDGGIILSGTRIDISASGPVRINGQDVEINNGGTALAGGAASGQTDEAGNTGNESAEGEQKGGSDTPTTVNNAADTTLDNRKILNDADAALRSQPAITRADDLKNIASPEHAPKMIVFAPPLQKEFESLWSASLSDGKVQEFGGVLVTDKNGNGELSLMNTGTDGTENAYMPNTSVPDEKEVLGTFHTHPYQKPDYTDISFSGTDAAMIVNTHQPLEVCQSGDGQFAFLRTDETPDTVDKNVIKKVVQDRTDELEDSDGKSFSDATKTAAREVAKQLNLGYYEGKNGILNLVPQ
jgi:type VI secretion system secreted protein VgrG